MAEFAKNVQRGMSNEERRIGHSSIFTGDFPILNASEAQYFYHGISSF